ncbi:tight adherance operon protein [Intestinirhabdus alba]|uniref:Tight adherance operon protein n=1 Tax=Intestinirhabdus alba TaxID=2899544 RepID=A0A6L6IHL2_9ENTR|nr:tight adherance operon protein [Intestinirhabdus alba]MTH45575.1 tight adherance operon protein [Intestinirhabdus alba]
MYSARESVNTSLSEMLRTAGFSDVGSFSQDLMTHSELSLPANAAGVIFDIGQCVDPEAVITRIQTVIPRDIWCCVVGDSDSITLAQSFSRQGIFYFNLKAQSEALIAAATAGTLAHSPRNTVCISVLGCKGGIGNTQIAWQLAQQMVQRRSMPTLFIQGLTGSHDLDLLIGKKLVQDITPVNKHLDAMQLDAESLPDLKQNTYDKYNFVLFEETINASSKETLRQLVENTTCLILVLDRSMASVRIVHTITGILDSLNRSQSTPRRLILCLSDSRPVMPGMLSIEELQSLLERQLDIVFPYKKSTGLPAFKLRKSLSPIDLLTQRVLGAPAPASSRFLIRLTQKS